MSKIKVIIVCTFLGLCCGQKSNSKPYTGARNDEFDWKLVKNLLGAEKSNSIISPFSVKLLLVLLYEATGYAANIKTKTELELQQIFGATSMPDITNERKYYTDLLSSSARNDKDFDLNIGTKIFIDESLAVFGKYETTINYFYSTEIVNVNFNNADQTVTTVNSWCSEATHGRIKSLVTAENIAKAVMLMANAIYFKGLWIHPFPDDSSNIKSFYLEGSGPVDAVFMEQTVELYFHQSQTLNAKFLRLPYKGEKLSMLFILPDETSSVKELVSAITTMALHESIAKMAKIDVQVVIPRFEFDHYLDLKRPLQMLGINEIFTANASLPLLSRGIGTKNKLYVSNIMQKAGISIDAMGSTAFAATKVKIESKFSDEETKKIFIANRPFIFMIEDERNGACLFVGKVENPL